MAEGVARHAAHVAEKTAERIAGLTVPPTAYHVPAPAEITKEETMERVATMAVADIPALAEGTTEMDRGNPSTVHIISRLS